MKKISKHVTSILIGVVVLLVLGYAFYNSTFAGFCDGLALHLYQIFEQQTPSEPQIGFTEAINQNTEILEDCTVVSYTKVATSDLHEWLRKYEIEKYNVKYQCDILSFSLDIYKLGNKFYTLSYEMGPCSEENVYFDLIPENNAARWYNTKYSLEYMVISDNLKNHTFCAALEKKIYGKDENRCK